MLTDDFSDLSEFQRLTDRQTNFRSKSSP